MRGRRIWVGLSGALVAACLCGCAPAETNEVTNPWEADFEIARGQTKNAEVLDMLADGVVTDAEVERARQIALDCFAAEGVTASYDGDQLSVASGDGVGKDRADAVVEKCAGTSYDLVAFLHQAVEYNPTNIPRERLITDCLKKFDVVPGSFRPDEFLSVDLDNPPWDPESLDLAGCLSDPINYDGYTPQQTP